MPPPARELVRDLANISYRLSIGSLVLSLSSVCLTHYAINEDAVVRDDADEDERGGIHHPHHPASSP